MQCAKWLPTFRVCLLLPPNPKRAHHVGVTVSFVTIFRTPTHTEITAGQSHLSPYKVNLLSVLLDERKTKNPQRKWGMNLLIFSTFAVFADEVLNFAPLTKPLLRHYRFSSFLRTHTSSLGSPARFLQTLA